MRYIDWEYPGYDNFIKKQVVAFFDRFSARKIDIHKLHITSIGKSSNAHRVANFSAKGEYKTIKITATEIIRILENKKSGSTQVPTGYGGSVPHPIFNIILSKQNKYVKI